MTKSIKTMSEHKKSGRAAGGGARGWFFIFFFFYLLMRNYQSTEADGVSSGLARRDGSDSRPMPDKPVMFKVIPPKTRTGRTDRQSKTSRSARILQPCLVFTPVRTRSAWMTPSWNYWSRPRSNNEKLRPSVWRTAAIRGAAKCVRNTLLRLKAKRDYKNSRAVKSL